MKRFYGTDLYVLIHLQSDDTGMPQSLGPQLALTGKVS
jgi:hypothetical protein